MEIEITDKQRLDFLGKNKVWVSFDFRVWEGTKKLYFKVDIYSAKKEYFDKNYTGNTVREAIDAAIKAMEGEK